MNTEQKVKRYDEAIKIAKEINNEQHAQPFNVMTRVFPELKESEDERIRKAIKLMYSFLPNKPKYIGDVSVEDMFAWLEKQSTPQVRTGLEWVNTIDDACDKRYSEEYAHGEYCHKQSFKWGFSEGVDWLEKQGENHIVGNNEMVKPIDKVEQKPVVYIPKFHVGDKLVSTYNTSLTYEVLEVGHINGLGNPDYKVEIFTDGKAENPRNIHYMECYKVDEWAKLIEQKHAWSEEDEAGLGDALWAVQQARTLAKDENDMGNLWYAEKWLNSLKGRLQPNQYWSKEDEKIYQSILDDTVQENQLDDKQTDWLKSLKDRVQPKQEWSQDDEQYLLVCKNALAKYQTTDKWDATIISQWLENKLKFLKDRVQPQLKQEWSKEDEKIVEHLINLYKVNLKVNHYPDLEVNKKVNELKMFFKSLRPQNRWKPSEEQMDALRYVTNFDYGGYKAALVSLYEQLKKLGIMMNLPSTE